MNEHFFPVQLSNLQKILIEFLNGISEQEKNKRETQRERERERERGGREFCN